MTHLHPGITKLTTAAGALDSSRSRPSSTAKTAILAANTAFQQADIKLRDITSSITRELNSATGQLRDVSKSVTSTQKSVPRTQTQLSTQTTLVSNQQSLVNSAAWDKYYAQLEKNSQQHKYNRAVKSQKDWEIACWATIWIPFVGIGTCTKAIVKDSDLASASSKLRSAERRYNSLNSNLSSMKARKTSLEKSLNNYKSNLDWYRNKLRTYQQRKSDLEKQQRSLSHLGTQFRTMVGKMRVIVDSAASFTVRGRTGIVRVKTLMRSLSTSMRRTVNAISSSQTDLCVQRSDVTRLEAAARSFCQKVDRDTSFDIDLF